MITKLGQNGFMKFVFVLFSFLMLAGFYMMPTLAKCPENVVPNIMDPECNLPAGTLNPGFLLNRVLPFVPFGVVISSVIGIIVAVFKIQTGGEDGRTEGIKWLVNIGIGLVLFGSIWLILFLISVITGVDLLSSIGK